MGLTPQQFYSSLLGISAAAGEEELRQRYRQLARENHPDRFPPEEREDRSLRMAQINEAYRAWRRRLRGLPQRRAEIIPPQATTSDPKDAAGNDRFAAGMLAPVRDRAYALYKQGFVHYSRGAGGMMFRGRSTRIPPDERGLHRVLSSLEAFLQAQGCFQRLVERYPESIWSADAEWKLVRIRGFLRVYQSIRGNLESRLQAARDTAGQAAP